MAIDDTLKLVVAEIRWAITIIPMVAIRPASPTIIGKRIYIITPRMVKMEGVKTPLKVLNLLDCAKVDYELDVRH